MPGRVLQYYSQHFDAKRTKETHGDMSVLREGLISLSVAAGSTHLDHLKEICSRSNRPLAIKFLSEQLNERRFSRGDTFLGRLGNYIDQIVANYPYLRWWIEEDGLVVTEAVSELGPLSEFDRIAGPLVVEHWKDAGLSASSLGFIASRLDAEGIQLRISLQPAQWKLISEHNMKFSRSPIKTFADAVQRPQFVRNVRRRLYLARDRYKKALRPAEPIYFETI